MFNLLSFLKNPSPEEEEDGEGGVPSEEENKPCILLKARWDLDGVNGVIGASSCIACSDDAGGDGGIERGGIVGKELPNSREAVNLIPFLLLPSDTRLVPLLLPDCIGWGSFESWIDSVGELLTSLSSPAAKFSSIGKEGGSNFLFSWCPLLSMYSLGGMVYCLLAQLDLLGVCSSVSSPTFIVGKF